MVRYLKLASDCDNSAFYGQKMNSKMKPNYTAYSFFMKK